MSRFFFLIAFFLLGLMVDASAKSRPVYMAQKPAQAAAYTDNNKIPDMLSIGLGYQNFDKDESHRQSADIRGEYRWGMSLLPMISPWFNSWDQYVQFHPMAGGELGTLGQLYGFGGFAMDAYLGRHAVFTWSEGAGLYYPGAAVALGSILEFRSQFELGWRFDNNVRITGYFSHISNAKITNWNPGSETIGVYLHLPIDMVWRQ
jgi:hypothetical protein